MSLRLGVVTLTPLFVAATAYAQAPGQWSEPPTAPVQGPTYAAPPPQIVVVTPPRHDTRFSVGLNVGSTGIAPSMHEGDSVNFDGASLSFRYRPWDHLELQLDLGGGRQSYSDGDYVAQGDLAMGYGTLAARYRFNPHARWNWFLSAGLGVITVAPHDASDEVIDAAQRPLFTFGGGVEWRLAHRFALQFSLEGIAAGETDAEMKLADRGYESTDSWSGGRFALGGNFYF